MPSEGGEKVDLFTELVIAVLADLIAHYIRKRFDSNDGKEDKEPKED